MKDRILDYLSVLELKPDMKGPILCFVGPPGVGKTSLGRSIARSLGRKFQRIAVSADTDVLTPPCGACRQILWEFCGDIELTLVNLHGKTETLHLRDLFPRPFDASFL